MIKTIEHFNHFKSSREYLASPYGDTGIPLSTLLMLGILIHDIGHTPFSHTLEDVLDLKEQGLLHDQYWNRKILNEDKELQRIWKRHNIPQAANAVMDFMGENGGP